MSLTLVKCNLLINENFTLCCEVDIFKSEALIMDQVSEGAIVTHFDQIKPFKHMQLTFESRRIQFTPNAGGSSVESETLSFEILKKFFNAHLISTEMEVNYWPEGGSITDYVCLLFGAVIGVSVTRAMKYNGEAFTLADASALLQKKLKGISQSSRNSMLKWRKQILHVWIMSPQACESICLAWSKLDRQLKSNTVLLITLAENSREVFVSQSGKRKREN